MVPQIPQGDFRAFIFDCDGTLADNMPIHYQAWTRAMDDFGGSFPEELFYRWGGTPTIEIVHRLNAMHGLSMEADDVVLHKENYYREMINQVEPKLEVVEIARRYHGTIPLAVASGGHRDLVVRTLVLLGIHDLFKVVIAAEDYERGKPFPDPFLTAARALGVLPEECLVFEDTTTGATAATAAGMIYVLV